MRNINDRREQRVRARRRDATLLDASARERSHGHSLQFCVYAAAGGGYCIREEGMGVMATCNNIVDSYCFVIGPRCDPTRHDASAPPSDAAPNILCGGRFIGNFPRPTSGFPQFFRSRGGRDDAALFHIRFLPTRVFALFFLFFFKFLFVFFSRE